MVRSYLLKDVLMLHELRESEKILLLLQLLAWQIGQEVSTRELGRDDNSNIQECTTRLFFEIFPGYGMLMFFW